MRNGHIIFAFSFEAFSVSRHNQDSCLSVLIPCVMEKQNGMAAFPNKINAELQAWHCKKLQVGRASDIIKSQFLPPDLLYLSDFLGEYELASRYTVLTMASVAQLVGVSL